MFDLTDARVWLRRKVRQRRKEYNRPTGGKSILDKLELACFTLKGLDLILQTPGGDVAATESPIDYLHSLCKGNIRAIVPQLAGLGI